MSVRSLAPAKAGAGRGVNLDIDSGMSCFEEDVEGPFSVWEGKTDMSCRDKSSSKQLKTLISTYWHHKKRSIFMYGLQAHLYSVHWFL